MGQSTNVFSMDRFIVALLFLQVSVGLAAADLSCVVCLSQTGAVSKACEGAVNVNATDFPNSFVKQCTGVQAGTHCFATHTVQGATHTWARGCCSPDDDVTGVLCQNTHESAEGVEVKQNFCSDNLCNVMDPNGAAAITGSIMMAVMLAVALSLN